MSHFANHSEENYLKTLYSLSARETGKVNNTALARALDLNPATVLEMVRKLSQKSLVDVRPDKTIALSDKGRKKALITVRKHRLWEVFLVNKLGYEWTEVHELAEQLEHVDSSDLIDRLEAFLDFPGADPHGDPIPDKNGKIKQHPSIPLATGLRGRNYTVTNFGETDDAFLDQLGKLGIRPGTRIKLREIHAYDQSMEVTIQKKNISLSDKLARNILVQPA